MASSIGIKIANGEFFSIVEENAQVKKRLVLTTVHDNQSSVQIDLYKSFTRTMADSLYIGSLVLENIKPRPKGEPSIELVISSDRNGDINADAIDLDTSKKGERQTLSVSLKSLDEDNRENDLPDFEFEDSEGPPTGLYEKTQEVRYDEEKKKFPWLVLVLAALVLTAVGLVIWLYFFHWGGNKLLSSLPVAGAAQPAAQTQPETPPAQPAAQTQPETPPAQPAAQTQPETPPAQPAAQTQPETPAAQPAAQTQPETPPAQPVAQAQPETPPAQPVAQAQPETPPAQPVAQAQPETPPAQPAQAQSAQTQPAQTQQTAPPVIQAPAQAPVNTTQARRTQPAPVASYNVPSNIPREGAPYRIRYGDTLWDIAEAFYRNPWLYPRIAQFNNIRNPDLIISGTTILVPPRN